ncbi:hypothetical protein C2E23DRAFT_767764 [Lenzites betulinus]|nr:hypothetical protein C2E23DRAFT_767764 [Lenzites betulinus]
MHWHKLPFDIVHTLLNFTEITDLVSLCSTCRPLRAHIKNESIWRRVCSAYGVRDTTYFDGNSAYAVYTRLLHPYGPLLGLWANDSPFYGKILEFNLFLGNQDEQGGIIGEVFTSPPAEPPDTDNPAPPTYTRVLKISFEPGGSLSGSEAAEDDDKPGTVHVFCDHGKRNPPEPTATPSRHRSSLVRLSETTLAKFLQFYRRKVHLPEFPPHISPWYDSSRSLPRIPELAETTTHHRDVIKLYPAARLPAVWTGPTLVTKPAAISVRCTHPECRCAPLHATVLPFANLDERAPRYYPLKSGLPPRAPHPDEDAWAVASLDGIWYGSYGPNGTECIYLAPGADAASVEATKITGDVHVPRGCVSWIVHCPTTEMQRATLLAHWSAVRTDEFIPRRLLGGQGTIAGRGFTDMAIVDIVAGIISEDQIDVFWTEIHEFRTYKRYKGRQPPP